MLDHFDVVQLREVELKVQRELSERRQELLAKVNWVIRLSVYVLMPKSPTLTGREPS